MEPLYKKSAKDQHIRQPSDKSDTPREQDKQDTEPIGPEIS